jgi:Kef-type K+ transport system membrane component KefB
MSFPYLNVAMTLGILLGVSLIAGLVADRMHLPKVTAYLLVGLLLGPSVLDAIPHEHVLIFDPMLKLAMALVLFNLGCRFSLKYLRRIFKRTLPLSVGELAGTFALVTIALLICGRPWHTALLLGCLALATAPATTVLVLKELRSEGPLTEYASVMVAFNNLVAIVVFEAAFLLIELLHGGQSTPLGTQVGFLALDLCGSLLLGGTAGLLVSYGCGSLGRGHWLVMLVAVTTCLLGICEALHVPYMLTFLVMGLMVANASELTSRITEELDHLTGLLCVLFFAVHGAELDLGAFQSLGIAGAAYVVARLAGKYFGTYTAAIVCREPQEIRRWLGTTLMSQAGAAIGLSAVAVHRDAVIGEPVQVVILGSVVVFEFIGPILIRQSALHSGEVPIAQAIHHTSNTPIGQLTSIWDRLRMALRRSPVPSNGPRELTVSQLMRKNVQGIQQSANFDDVLAFIEHSHDNTYPVIDGRGGVVGVIRYPLLSSAFFDPSVSYLVRAEDLATPASILLFPDDSVAHVREVFRRVSDDCLPVVSREEPRTLLGVVRRAEFTHLLIRRHRNTK